MPLGKLLESGKLDHTTKDINIPVILLDEEEKKSQDKNGDEVLKASGEGTMGDTNTEQHISLNSLYLQLDNKVKKVSYNGPLTIAGLKMLFVEKYQYNPGPYEFPDLYIKDPIIDVYYELEDLAEVREGSVLQLNVTVSSNDLKKNMDSNFSTLVMEIRDLRRLMTQNHEASKKKNNRLSMALPTTSRFSDLAKLSINKNKDNEASTPTSKPKVDLGHLKSQVANLRQDLAIARQLSTDFQKESNDSLSNILDITASFNQQLNSDNDAMHRLLVSGKDRMEANALELANSLEDVQKNIEEFRQDLVQRRCQPSELKMKHTSKALEKINQLLLTESEFLSEVKPSWKKTWEIMLQDIVKEQQTLKEHEAIVEDMRADHEHLNETFMQLKKFTELKRKSQVQQRSFEVEPVDEEFARQALLQEISCVETNSERRLRAFEEARQSREWELRNQVNPFEEELSDFVGSAKLRKTGGTEELERKRRQQDEENLKAMLAPRPRPTSKSAR
ncbi:Bud site selection protein 6 [Entomophthora muscae]|uniref:Bud site selection protein 6 n=2 Tax=Entomophthora muscae TaxID=34485 RepID=A0ACC2SRR8_9FUNG|nr:Bud site selection protein 6 [Entomophthora muscae]